jgi:hypothetical protein
MQPGDLVKLVAVYGGGDRTVIVFHDPSGSTRLPEGTGAVFLGCFGSDEGNPCILVEGRVGWVWEEELEAL